MELSNKTVFITGASRGIGEATAREFAANGANVVLAARSDRDIQRIAAEIGQTALPIQCDVSSYADVQKAIDQTLSHFGGLDVLVNNAGTIEPIARLEDSDPDGWDIAVDINLKGVYHCMRAAHGPLRQTGGVIVNISSGAATGALEGWSHYCATKAAVLSHTKCAHKEWAEHGIRVVGLSPGTVATNMQNAIKASDINPVSKQDWSSHIPPEWVAKAILWLTGEAAREFDGGDFSLKAEGSLQLVGLKS